MSAISAELTTEKSNAGRAIFLGGVAAGILDITAAFVNTWIQTGRSPRWVLQSIASGFLGAESYKGGWTTAALGAVLHFTVAFVACTVFYLASRKIKVMLERPIICGVIYGVLVCLFMYGVVLPITFGRAFFISLLTVTIPMIVHIFCVGLPISLAVRRYSD